MWTFFEENYQINNRKERNFGADLNQKGVWKIHSKIYVDANIK